MAVSSELRYDDQVQGGDDELATNRGAVAYFAPDAADPAVHRRVAQWRRAGHDIKAFVFARSSSDSDDTAEFINLGYLAHQSRLSRPFALLRALARLWRQRRSLKGTQLFIGRNLDNAVLALITRRLTRSPAPIVYEVLDINDACTGSGASARLLRFIERWLLRRINLLVVSSPHYMSSYYERYYNFSGPWMLFENKIPQHAKFPIRTTLRTTKSRTWRIGWFGYLDDEKSWQLLRQLAERHPLDIEIHVRGRPYNNFDTDRFLTDVAHLRNVTYKGAYKSPDDLSAIYGAVDMVWSSDLNNLGGNSSWLLTNSVYEALYFGKPLISLAGTAVGEFISEYNAGWCLNEPLETDLARLVSELTDTAYLQKCNSIAKIPADRLVESDEISRIFEIAK